MTATRTLLVLLAVVALVCLLVGVGLPVLYPGRIEERTAGLVAGFGVGTGLGVVFAALLRRRLPAACDAAPAALRRRYTREMVVAMVCYAAALVLSMLALKQLDLAPVLRAVVALAPIVPVAFMLRAMMRYIRDTDEMQQRIELEAISAATALVCTLYMGGGFLQLSGVIDVPAAVAMIWVFPLATAFYGIAKAVVVRRYR